MLRSLHSRLVAGAAVIAAMAALSAALVVWTGQATRAGLDAALAAERRIELMTRLAWQVSGYGMLALETARSPGPAMIDRLEAEARGIGEQFGAIDAAFADAMENRALSFDDRTAIATRNNGVANMRAAFDRLASNVREAPASSGRQNDLEFFAAGFSPYLNTTIAEEQRVRTAAFDRIERLRRRSTALAGLLTAATVTLLAVFVAAVVAPIFRRLDLLHEAARRMAAGDLAVALPAGARDEFAPLYRETLRLAERLAGEAEQVAADRARLNEIVADRTAQLSEANERLARIDADRRRFFADLSHELRTPLTVILMEAELAQRNGAASPAFEVIRSRAQRLSRRIDDMLRVARSVSGRIEMEPARIDLAAVAAAAVADAQRAAGVAGMTIELDAAPVAVIADATWTRQVLEGLIDNAIRHAAVGGRIVLRVDAAEEAGRVRVIDNGPGLAGDPEALFERFERGGTGGRRGFGIGLALARWIVEEQGGRITIASPVPEGSRIGDAPGTLLTLTLPKANP